MLVGLAGVLLPIIAHLLSRKTFDVVDWGAMQFLKLDPSAKRKIRLEEILLMLVRMVLVVVIAIAFARPWIGGQWLSGLVSTQPRDVVLIIDGSYSMDWEGPQMTPRLRSLQLARQFLTDLLPGDTIQLIDAREQPQVVLTEATRDAYRIREALNDLPSPSGSANLPAAIKRAIQLLATGNHLHREVIVFTDLQAFGWNVADENLWTRFDDIRNQTPGRAPHLDCRCCTGGTGAGTQFHPRTAEAVPRTGGNRNPHQNQQYREICWWRRPNDTQGVP